MDEELPGPRSDEAEFADDDADNAVGAPPCACQAIRKAQPREDFQPIHVNWRWLAAITHEEIDQLAASTLRTPV